VLDGVLSVVIDGEVVRELGPGAILGERAVLEGGIRTATLSAATNVRVAVASPTRSTATRCSSSRRAHRREDPCRRGR
jgi:CRP-like cAMP-binding protein